MFACEKSSPDVVSIEERMISSQITKVENKTHYISLEDINHYVQFINALRGEKKRGEIKEVAPIKYQNDDYAYILNFEKGWQIISSDNRGPIVLAESPHGNMSIRDMNSNLQYWLEMLFEDIKYRREYQSDYYQNLASEGLEAEKQSQAIWDRILSEHSQKTPTGEPLIPPGRYEYSYTYTTTSADSLNHLISTHWDQYSPNNNYCPLKTASGIQRCPVGCVGIAGAQVLYYLHNYLGKPLYSPTEGYCIGYTDNYYAEFSSYAATTWDIMGGPSDVNDYRGLFIGSVAHSAKTSFGETGSSSTLSKLRQYSFQQYGITCDYSNTYNRDTVYNNLLSGLPVIFGGNRYENLFSWPGHAWIIDGYVREITIYHDVYEWVYLTPPTSPVPNIPPIEETYQTAQLAFFKMNWGWGNLHGEDDGNYATSGTWADPFHPNPYIFSKEILTRYR